MIIDIMRNDPFVRECVRQELALGIGRGSDRKLKKQYIYGIQAGDAVKIGFTSKPPKERLDQLQTGQSVPLKLVALYRGTRQGERLLHKKFADAKLHGEWFDAKHPRIAAWVSRHRYVKGAEILDAFQKPV